jgi:hypothetical protein
VFHGVVIIIIIIIIIIGVVSCHTPFLPGSSLELAVTPTTQASSFSLQEDKGKGKAIPLQALTGPEGSRRMRLPDFKTNGA